MNANAGKGGCLDGGKRDFESSEREHVTVLLIDDNPLQLSVREAVLRNADFSVTVATTADSALATVRSLGKCVGIIVTDHIMPGRSGSEFVRLLRQENTWVPVIVLSGLPEAAAEYDGMGVTFRQKPLPPQDLIALVREHIRNKSPQTGAA